MNKVLRIANDLELPLNAVTQTFAFIARRGAGKTYAAGKLCEEMLGVESLSRRRRIYYFPKD